MVSASVRLPLAPIVSGCCRSRLTGLCLLAGDTTAIVFAWFLAIMVDLLLGAQVDVLSYLRLFPVLLALLGAFWICGLYPGAGVSPIEELSLLVRLTTGVYISLIVVTFFLRHDRAYSRVIFVVAWALCLCFLPFIRAQARKKGGALAWWGSPVVLVGSGASASAVLKTLRTNPGLGIRVQAVVTQLVTQERFEGAPVFRGLGHLPDLIEKTGIRRAIIAPSPEERLSVADVMLTYGRYFPQLLIVPEVLGPSNLYVKARGLGRLLVLGVHQNLLRRAPRIQKRLFDCLGATLGGILAIPLFIAIATAIKATSRGPILYRQIRVGKEGKTFHALKFRTMATDADEILGANLAANPASLLEWQSSHKLRNDPRVTRVGRALRKLSLDELPQLWNVLVGEMSLTGPRPIVSAEIARYGKDFDVYSRVLPGITGLWQVSGRNDTTYKERVGLDCYYVYNWSFWLDFYILGQTFKAVFKQKGAY